MTNAKNTNTPRVDWVPSLKVAMSDVSQVGDTYQVQHVYFADGKYWDVGGSFYRKDKNGYSSCALQNKEVCFPKEGLPWD